jgi:hypothetical protein
LSERNDSLAPFGTHAIVLMPAQQRARTQSLNNAAFTAFLV